MKKLLFVFILVLFVLPLFAQSIDFIDSWDVTVIDTENVSEKMVIDISNKELVIRRLNGSISKHEWETKDKYFFIATLGYELHIVNKSNFYLVPAHGHFTVKKIIFTRK